MQIVTHRNFLAGIVQKSEHHHCRDNAEPNVAIAAPATPRWKPQISTAFPAIFNPLETTAIVIGSLVFPCAR